MWDWGSWRFGENVGATIGTTKFAQKYAPRLFKLFFIGVLIAGFVYAFIVFHAVRQQALHERSKPNHVHTQRSH